MKRIVSLCGFLLFPLCGLQAQATVPVVSAAPAARTIILGRSSGTTLDLTTVFAVPGVTGPVAQFDTYLGLFNVELFPDAAPAHVANFLTYVNAGDYSNTFFHRVASFPAGSSPSILQGGGYRIGTGLPAIPKRPSVALEYSLPNARGTLAAARTTDPDSATSEWFFNTRDNSTILGPLNDGFGYSVFGRVIGTGMTIVDTFATLPLENLDPGNPNTPFAAVPLIPFEGQLYYSGINRIVPVPLFPGAEGETAVVSFTSSSDQTSLATATVIDGRTLLLTPVAAGTVTVTLTATDTNQNSAATSFVLTVVPDPFLAALDAAGVPIEQRTVIADPDADGVSNLLEYALGGDPASAASAPRPLLSRAAGPDAPLQLTYTRAAADVSYEVQTTTDLASPASWTSTGVTQGTPDANGLTTATAPVGTGPRFLRLLVTLTP